MAAWSGPRWTDFGTFLGTRNSQFFFVTRVIVWDRPLVVSFTFPFSQPEPDLSKSFFDILLANNTVCGVVGLEDIDRPGRCRNINA